MIIGVTGTLGAGKGAIVKYLLERGFKRYSVRAFLSEEVLKRGLEVNRENMVLVANDLRERFGGSYIIEELYKRAKEVGGDAVVYSVRSLAEVEALRKKEGFVLVGIDADVETRYARFVERDGVAGKISFDDFLAQEQREISNGLDLQNLAACIENADYVFKNNWTIAELEGKVEKVLKEISRSRKKDVYCSGILSDVQIKRKVASGEIEISPYDVECVQPASYDLHLDTQFKIFRPHRTEIIDTRNPVKDLMENADLGGRNSFVLHPGSFALALVKEITGVDSKHVGRLEGKSSLARLGLIIHTTAGFLDPGNSLQLTLELFNASPLPIKLYPGMKIAQIAFEELSEPCEVPYGKERGSSYYGVRHIQESEMHKNFEKYDEKTGLYNPGK
jgi:deoxycytidine triphosphate deaminase